MSSLLHPARLLWTFLSACLFLKLSGGIMGSNAKDITLSHSREKWSAAMLSTPFKNSILKLYSIICIFQRHTLGDPSRLMYVRFLWSVRRVNFVSRKIYACLSNAYTSALTIWAVNDLLRKVVGFFTRGFHLKQKSICVIVWGICVQKVWKLFVEAAQL